MMKRFIFAVFILSSFLAISCSRPFDVPEFVEIGTNETAFIVPLTGDTTKQGGFMSEDYLRKNMLATKRVQIPHEWLQTGKGSGSGKYIPIVVVIKVNRTPVSVTWKETDAQTKIGVESKESIGFTIPISLTVMIDQENTPVFLNKYTANKSLSDVVNTDINSFIKTEASARFGILTLEECKTQKNKYLVVYLNRRRFFSNNTE